MRLVILFLLLAGCSEEWDTMPEKMLTPTPTATATPEPEGTPVLCKLKVNFSDRKSVCIN